MRRIGLRSGFALTELLLTVTLVTVFLLVFLRFVDRTTRVADARVVLDPRAALRSANESLTRDLRAAAAGTLSAADSIRRLHDNVRDGGVLDASGSSVAFRPGTDGIELRGVLRYPLFRLDSRNRATGEDFSSSLSSAHPGLFQKSLSNASLLIYVDPGAENSSRSWLSERSGGAAMRPRMSRTGLGAEIAHESFDSTFAAIRHRAAGAMTSAYFTVTDLEGGYAVGRVLSFDVSRLSDPSACPAGGSGCFAEVHLDFTDPGAVTLNRGGDPRAAERLGALATGGLFDRILYFIAQGDAGRLPDYEAGIDPPSLGFPHPYLASAVDMGQGRFAISRVANDIEDLQIMYRTESEPGEGSSFTQGVSAASWQVPVDRSEISSEGSLVDFFGRTRLRGVRVALVAKNADRMQPGEAFAGARGQAVSLEGRDGYWLLNAPRPEIDRTMPGPIGWSAEATQRVPFLRRFALFDVPVPGFAQ